MTGKDADKFTSRYWRERAEEARARAAEMRRAKGTESVMLVIARMYDQMADLAAAREGNKK